MLTFISYGERRPSCLNALGSSAFYAAVSAEQALGKSAPWFILRGCLFLVRVRAVYVESFSMFVPAGASIVVVKEALGALIGQDPACPLCMFD